MYLPFADRVKVSGLRIAAGSALSAERRYRFGMEDEPVNDRLHTLFNTGVSRRSPAAPLQLGLMGPEKNIRGNSSLDRFFRCNAFRYLQEFTPLLILA